jgi:hypothetical protein
VEKIDVHLRTSVALLLSLQSGLSGWSGVAPEPLQSTIWLQRDDQLILISVDNHDVCFQFEVFTLFVEPRDSVLARLKLADESVVSPPLFEPWPFDGWDLGVLMRTEFVSAPNDGHSLLGQNPMAQSATRLRETVTDGLHCTVAVGLQFRAKDGRRLLIAADWFPFALSVLTDSGQIDAFLETCTEIDAPAYAAHLDVASK